MIRRIHDSASNIRIFGFDRIKMPFTGSIKQTMNDQDEEFQVEIMDDEFSGIPSRETPAADQYTFTGAGDVEHKMGNVQAAIYRPKSTL